MKISFSLRLPREAASVPLVRHVCGDALACLGVRRSCAEDVELALTEACTNVLKHAAGGSDEYDVSLEIVGKTCEIRIVDAGSGFDSAMQVNDADYTDEDPAESGRGILLMQAVCDDLSFVSEGATGTIVRLAKELSFDDESLLRDLAMAGAEPTG